MTHNNYTRLAFLFTLTLALLWPVKAESSTSDDLQSVATKLSWVNHRIELERYLLAVEGHTDSLSFFEGLRSALLVSIDSSWCGAEGEGLDERSTRLMRLLGFTGAVYRIEQSKAVSSLRDSLTDMLGGIPGLLEVGNNLREEEIRRQCARGNKADEILSQLIKERNRLARKAGYSDFYSLSAIQAGFNEDDLHNLIVRALQSSEKGYNNELSSNGNPAKPDLWDIGAGLSASLRSYDGFFTADTQLSRIKDLLAFIGIDISALPLFVEEISEQGGVYFVNPPADIRITVESSDGLAAFERTTELLSIGVAKSMLDKNRGLFATINEQPWDIALRRLLIRFYRLPESLKRISGMPTSRIQAFIEVTKRKDIIDARKRLLESEFEYQLYNNPDQNVSKLYWELCEKQLGVVVRDDIDAWKVSAGAIIHPLSSANALAGEISAEQIISSLSRRLNDKTTDNSSASFLIQNFFRFGSRYPWSEILLRGTDEHLNPDYLLLQN